MSSVSTAGLALAMSADAFAAAIGKGAALNRPRLREALRTGLIFGTIEAITPVVGWAVGSAAARYVTAWDHWIAFVLLSVLGARMIYASLSPAGEAAERADSHSLWILAATGLATSIDALVVGISLAFVDANILVTAAAIGLTTFTMVTIGVMLGRLLGAVVGRRAEMAGGFLLIVIGAAILYEHLTAIAAASPG